MALTDKLVAIADGFRSSRGTTKKYTLDEMATLAAEPINNGSTTTSDFTIGYGYNNPASNTKTLYFNDVNLTTMQNYTIYFSVYSSSKYYVYRIKKTNGGYSHSMSSTSSGGNMLTQSMDWVNSTVDSTINGDFTINSDNIVIKSTSSYSFNNKSVAFIIY